MTQRDRREDGQRHRDEKQERMGGEARQDRALVSVQSQNRSRRRDGASKRWTERSTEDRPPSRSVQSDHGETPDDNTAGGEEGEDVGFVLAVNPAGFPPAAKLSVVTQTVPDVVGNRGAPQRGNMGPPASPGCTRAVLSDEMGPGWCL